MNKIKSKVREAYGKIAKGKSSGCCGPETSCGCSDTDAFAKGIGYSAEDLKNLPEGANLGLGCGSPTSIAALKAGEIVLDLGSGAGVDCLLAAKKVGPAGKVFGVDMTPEMLEKARKNAKTAGAKNVEFRLGEIENLPVPDNSVDVVISNCVINLSTDKRQVFREIFRALKPGGRIAVSDMVLLKELPDEVKKSSEAYVGCVAGALLLDDYKSAVTDSGLQDAKFTVKRSSACISEDSQDPLGQALQKGIRKEVLEDYVASLYVEARKK